MNTTETILLSFAIATSMFSVIYCVRLFRIVDLLEARIKTLEMRLFRIQKEKEE